MLETRETESPQPAAEGEAPVRGAPGKAGTQAHRTGGAPQAGDGTGASTRGRMPRIVRRHPLGAALVALGLLALAAGAYAYWLLALHPFETTDDAFVDARQFPVAAKVSGYVVDVPVTDNQHVEAGATLFQIDRRDYDVAQDQARAQIASAQASIDDFAAQIQGQQAQVAAAEAQVAQTEASLKFAQEDAARYRDLADRGAGTVQQEQSTTSTLAQQQASLKSARANLDVAKTRVGALEAQKAGAEASLAQARAQAAQAALNLGYTHLTAAQPGRIVQLSGAKGAFVQAGQALATFVPDDIWVTANYKETQIDRIRPGQRADIAIDAYPDRRIIGHVASVQPGSGTAFSLLPAQNATGNYVKVVQRIPVKIVVDKWPTDVSIGPGMSVVPKIHVQ